LRQLSQQSALLNPGGQSPHLLMHPFQSEHRTVQPGSCWGMTMATPTFDVLMFSQYDPRLIYSDASAANPGIFISHLYHS
jgi:hypothetical protein